MIRNCSLMSHEGVFWAVIVRIMRDCSVLDTCQSSGSACRFVHVVGAPVWRVWQPNAWETPQDCRVVACGTRTWRASPCCWPSGPGVRSRPAGWLTSRLIGGAPVAVASVLIYQWSPCDSCVSVSHVLYHFSHPDLLFSLRLFCLLMFCLKLSPALCYCFSVQLISGTVAHYFWSPALGFYCYSVELYERLAAVAAHYFLALGFCSVALYELPWIVETQYF